MAGGCSHARLTPYRRNAPRATAKAFDWQEQMTDDTTIARPDLIATLRDIVAAQQDRITALESLVQSRGADLAVAHEIARRALDQLAATQPTSHDTTNTKVTISLVTKAA